jgi:c-di-GMP-binding flagellar brake protein YcgR
MESESYQNERRQHERFEVPSLVIAVPKRNAAQIARIVNISKGGMAVRYLDQNNWLGDANEIDILANSTFFMTEIPINIVRDFKIENEMSFSIINERQCCLQFGDLNAEQMDQVDRFILQYTGGQA